MRYAFLAFCTPSRLDSTSSRRISCMSVALSLLHKKCPDSSLFINWSVHVMFVEAVYVCFLLLAFSVIVSHYSIL